MGSVKSVSGKFLGIAVLLAVCLGLCALAPQAAFAAEGSLDRATAAYTAFKNEYKADTGKVSWETLIKAARELELAQEAGVSEADLETITTYYATIKKFDMSGKKISDQKYYSGTDVGSLRFFPNLESLNLSGTGVGELGALAKLTKLKELDLSNTGFTNNSFGPIVQLTNLEKLSLANNDKLTAIGPLKDNTKLTTLDVSDTGLTQLQEPASFSFIIKNLTAKNLKLTHSQPISGLVGLTDKSSFSSANCKWDLSNSRMCSDADKHIEMLTAAFKNNPSNFKAPEVGHSWDEGSVTKAATCVVKGEKTYTCTLCKEKKTEEIPIDENAHDWGEWAQTKAASCTEKGTEQRTCKNAASHTETREIPALGHTWVFKEFTVETDSAETAVTAVYANYVCKNDSTHTKQVEAEFSLNSGSSIAATCTEAGVNVWSASISATASLDGVAHSDENIRSFQTAASGHSWGSWEVVKEATTEEEGLEKRTCSICGEEQTRAIAKKSSSSSEETTITYKATKGSGSSWTKGSSGTLDFTFKRSKKDSATFSHFIGVAVDGEEIDSENYTAKKGSVIVKLKAAYLEKLKVGTHTLSALFDDADPVTVKFNIKAKPSRASSSSATKKATASTSKASSSSAKAASTKTSDSANLPALMAVALFSLVGLVSASWELRKRRLHK